MTQNDEGLSQQEASRLFGGKKKQPTKQQQTMLDAMEKVRVHNLAELKKLVNRLKPDANEAPKPIIINTKDTEMADETYSGIVVIPQSGGQSTFRQTLLDGFTIVKNHREYYKASLASQTLVEEFGGYPPAVAPNPDEHLMWVDFFVERNMGGKRVGLHIVWDLPEGKFRLDPWSCKLEKIDAT